MSASSPHSPSPHASRPQPTARRNWLSRTAFAVMSVIDEMNDAQRRALRARMAYDQVLPNPAKAPDTFQEFLLRTSGPARHEPTASQRTAGRRVR